MMLLLLVGAITANSADDPADVQLREFLRRYLDVAAFPQEWATFYRQEQIDLNDDGRQEVVIYVSGRVWCGTGGCKLLVLAREQGGFKVVANTTITRPPIRLFSATQNGWHNLGVWVQGGGIQPGYEAELRFDGSSYPANPAVNPSGPADKTLKGTTIIPPLTEDDMDEL